MSIHGHLSCRIYWKDLLRHFIQHKEIWLYTHIKVWHNMFGKVGAVIENEKWKIKVFAHPKEHGLAHVHVIAKGEKAEVKISLVTLEVIGTTQFSIRAV